MCTSVATLQAGAGNKYVSKTIPGCGTKLWLRLSLYLLIWPPLVTSHGQVRIFRSLTDDSLDAVVKAHLPRYSLPADGVLAILSAASVLSLDITRILNRQRLGTHSKKTYYEFSIWYEITLMRGSRLFIVYSFRVWTIYKRARGVHTTSAMVRPWFVVSYITASWASHTVCAILLMCRESPISYWAYQGHSN